MTPAFLGTRMAALEASLAQALRTPHPVFDGFYGLMRYHVGPGGASAKRFRPVLCLLLYEGWTGDFKAALPLATALELMHSFSLVHDDIEDGDDLRRNRPAIWTVCGIPQGINVGDAIYALANEALRELSPWLHSPRVRLRVTDLFTHTAVRMAEGQYLDIGGPSRADVTLAAYQFMAARKTGALIKASALLAAALADANRRVQFAAARFGAELGAAFQAFDDWKGMWGTTANTGKTGRSDLMQRKLTLPVVFALATAGEPAQELRRVWSGAGLLSANEAERVRDLVEACGAEERLWTYAHTHLARARRELAGLGLDTRMALGIDDLLERFKPSRTAA